MKSYTNPSRRRRQAKLKYIGPRLANSDLWHPEPETAYILQRIANDNIARWYRKLCRAKTITCGADGCRPRLFGCALTREREAIMVCPDCFDPELHVRQGEQWIRKLGDW